ncbi:zinc finger protein 573 [Eurytemora carolleeae]|uniref:zinc finger protein 573 n=1 Tax=Eurytemora carolleeae TaxID=1294199 RepID=UPI000C76E964|nr:zinc finger protein 573 [Eurytemora carolleeae]|eukprot:XP_023320519.1 zinc finger protein 573-like [Eurytemora affinis]
MIFSRSLELSHFSDKMASFPDKMEDSEGQILLKNEISPLPEVYEMQEFNNCKVVFANKHVYSNTLLLGASDPFLKELLEQLPPYLEQCLLFPDYQDLEQFLQNDSTAKEEEILVEEEAAEIEPFPLLKLETQTWDTDDECNPSEDEEKRGNERKKTNRKWKRGEGIGIGSDGIEYKCDRCQKKFNNVLVLEIHVRKFHDPTANINPFFEHLENHEFRCKVCGIISNSRIGMRKHCNKSHIKKKSVACVECKKTFYYERELKFHMKVHSQEKTQFCSVCGEGFVYNQTMKRHYLNVHATEEEKNLLKNRFQCDKCGYSDMFLNRLKRHMETHSTSRNYACDVCGKTFTSKRYMQQHYRSNHVLPPQPARPKTAEQKAKEAARARIYRAIKAGKLPENYKQLPLSKPDVPDGENKS